MLKRRVNHDRPTTSRDLRYSGRIFSTPEALPPWRFSTTSVTSAYVMKSPTPSPQSLHDGRIEEILEVVLPPPDNVPIQGQQLPTPTVNSVGEALLPPPEVPDGLPESLRGQPFFSMASMNSSQALVFASATARAAACLASLYPSAASGVPQADHSQ
ncbi:hypothetical protein AMECASPLE_030825 [Ameca splendens]|uniref:Uncharacterized protein n=1 Tax=Ameca splendens TaxID=208324 RepID=A0ABV0ZTT2_9TELE